MRRNVVRARVAALLAALPLALALSSGAAAQEPALEVFYTRLEPKEPFKYKYRGADGKFVEAACTAGVFRWEVPRTEYGTNGMDRNFTGYCAEVLVPIVADKTYRFRTNNIYDPANYNLAGLKPADPAKLDEKAKAEGQARRGDAANRRARLVQELFGRHFRDPVLKAVDPTDAVAFQVALWEIVQETEPADGEVRLDLFAGDFQANYARNEAPAYVARAQEYLASLTGREDGLAVENPDLRGRELVRLQGVANAEGVVAQSQFALRYKGGGAAGAGAFSRALTAGGGAFGGGAPLGGFGGAGGGLGGGSGGGGGFLATNPGNGSTIPSTTTPGGSTVVTPPNTIPSTTPPAGGPDNPGGGDTPPGGGPDNPGGGDNPPPTNPVPGPAGLLLGAIALGTVGTWRYGARLLAAK